MINKIGFISYSVSNLRQSIEFYQDLLGLELLLSDDRWAEFNIGGQRLAIHKRNYEVVTGDQPGSTVFFEAKPIEDAVKKLRDKGVKFIGEIEVYSYGKLVLFMDPDKNSLGLYEPPAKN